MLAQKLCQLCGTFNCERFWKIPCATCVENLKKTRSMVFGSARTFTTSGFSGIRWDYPSIGSFSDLVSLVGQWHRNLELFAMVAWFIWYRHNKLWHNLKNQVFPPPRRYLTQLAISSQNFRVKLHPFIGSQDLILSSGQGRSHIVAWGGRGPCKNFFFSH